MNEQPASKPKRLPIREKIAWGTGGFSEQLAANGLNNLFIPIFNIGLGLDSVLIGWAISIPRFFDMISDPLMGNISDNCRSRFGRRRPFILIGSILMAVMFALTYMASPFWGTWTLFAYALGMCILFYLAYTVYTVPFAALGLELTDDYDERADVQKYRMVFAAFGTLTIPWLYKICISVGQMVRQVLEEGGAERYRILLRPVAALAADHNIAPEVLGVRYVAWIAAALIILTALPASLFTREKAQVGAAKKINLLKSAWLVFGNRSFRIQCLMIFLVITGMFFLGALMLYVNIFHVCGGDKSAAATWSGLYGSTTGAFSLASTFLIPILVRRFDKKKVLLAGVGSAALAILSSWFLLNPALPALQLTLSMFLGFGMSSCWLLNGAFIADICDEDELQNGVRREGMFSAVFGFSIKLAFTAIALLLGYVLKLIGYEAGANTMQPETVLRLRLFVALFPSSCLLLAILNFSRYSLNRQRVQEIQAELTRRRRQVDSQSISGDES
jgi:glycoside/pentoside/hexuronide:cation symporter, GPH family